MKIIIISDTHNNQKMLRKQMSLDLDYEVIFHLGDYYNDLDENYDLLEGRKYFHIPGILTESYLSRNTFPWKKVNLENWIFLLVHNRYNVPKDLSGIDFVCFGHTHNPEIYKEGNTIFLNPGHSKKNYDRGNVASHIIMNLSKDSAEIKFITYEGKIFNQVNVSR